MLVQTAFPLREQQIYLHDCNGCCHPLLPPLAVASRGTAQRKCNCNCKCCTARFYLEICPSSSRSCAVKVCPICKCDVARRAVLCSALLCCAAPGLTCPHKSQLHKPISHLLAQNAAHCGAAAWLCGVSGEVEIMQTFGALSTQLAGNRNRNRRWATQQKQQQQQQHE